MTVGPWNRIWPPAGLYSAGLQKVKNDCKRQKKNCKRQKRGCERQKSIAKGKTVLHKAKQGLQKATKRIANFPRAKKFAGSAQVWPQKCCTLCHQEPLQVRQRRVLLFFQFYLRWGLFKWSREMLLNGVLDRIFKKVTISIWNPAQPGKKSEICRFLQL